jgi:hypothetical protein
MIRTKGLKAMSNKAKKTRNQDLEDLVFNFPGRFERLWEDVRIPLFWSGAAVICLSLLVGFSVSRTGGERLAVLPYEMQDLIQKRQPGTSLTAALDQRLGQYRAETTKLAAARTNLEQRVAQLEETYGDITASIPIRQPTEAAASAAIAPPADASFKKTAEAAVTDEKSAGSLTMTTRSQFGIELGTDQTMGGLRTRWIKLMEQFGMIMTGYEPVISASDGEGGVTLHLVVGPFSNAQEAAEACAKLRVAGLSSCSPAPYDGQRLALR